MKIKRGDIYYIELYLEPGKISDHNKRSNGTLSFTGVELMDANGKRPRGWNDTDKSQFKFSTNVSLFADR